MHQSRDSSPLISFAKVLSRIWPAFLPMGSQDSALDPDVSTQQRHPPSTLGDDPSTHAAITEATASEIAIPILVIEAQPEKMPHENLDNAGDTRARQPSLQDVEPWLRQVLGEVAP